MLTYLLLDSFYACNSILARNLVGEPFSRMARLAYALSPQKTLFLGSP